VTRGAGAGASSGAASGAASGAGRRLKVALLTREYPPNVYGGAGVHVEYLSRSLAGLVDLTVHCQGGPDGGREGTVGPRDGSGARKAVVAHHPWAALDDQVLRIFSMDMSMADAVAGTDVVHSHTWYANLAGHLASLLYGVPHVVTMHSLEPLRPWKAEQLGGGYALSSWAERVAATSAAAVVAVSEGMRADILAAYPEISPERTRVIYNGIDTAEYAPDVDTGVLSRHGIDPGRPYVVFVGRITRQKGVPVLLRAAAMLDPAAQLVLCAGAADTPELRDEVTSLVSGLQASRTGVFWIPQMLPKRDIIQLLSHATVFACPSVYEPLGIVNLEAMACGTAVVASRVGGIPEVVSDGVTGLLVPPEDPAALGEALNALLRDPARALMMGEAGRARAVGEFSWDTVAAQTAALYTELAEKPG
jgi:starch synthase